MTTLERSIETYGKDMQLIVAMEEFSELTKELCKYLRGQGDIEHIKEEMADCYIMLSQLKIIFGIEGDGVTDVIQAKLVRLEKRLGERNSDNV